MFIRCASRQVSARKYHPVQFSGDDPDDVRHGNCRGNDTKRPSATRACRGRLAELMLKRPTEAVSRRSNGDKEMVDAILITAGHGSQFRRIFRHAHYVYKRGVAAVNGSRRWAARRTIM
jgi:hypothetical protein